MKDICIREEQTMDEVRKEIESMQAICMQLLRTKHYATIGEAGIFAIVQKAKALGINPLEALDGGLYYVQGKVGMSSEMMASLIRQRGHSIQQDPKNDNQNCILHGKRCDNGDTWTVSFSMDDAKKAGLARGMYEKYPRIMLYNRAMSMLARQLYPDIIRGAGYTKDELMEINRVPPEKPAEYEPPVASVTEKQAEELIELLSECDEEYRTQVMTFLERPPLCVTSLYQLPIGLYDRIKNAAEKKRSQRAEEEKREEIEEEAVL